MSPYVAIGPSEADAGYAARCCVSTVQASRNKADAALPPSPGGLRNGLSHTFSVFALLRLSFELLCGSVGAFFSMSYGQDCA